MSKCSRSNKVVFCHFSPWHLTVVTSHHIPSLFKPIMQLVFFHSVNWKLSEKAQAALDDSHGAPHKRKNDISNISSTVKKIWTDRDSISTGTAKAKAPANRGNNSSVPAAKTHTDGKSASSPQSLSLTQNTVTKQHRQSLVNKPQTQRRRKNSCQKIEMSS